MLSSGVLMRTAAKTKTDCLTPSWLCLAGAMRSKRFKGNDKIMTLTKHGNKWKRHQLPWQDRGSHFINRLFQVYTCNFVLVLMAL
ncbi:MAG TPA: hypothetical protein DCP92_05780 [Nitrospiraceae bacterium]|nr:hypothetical protein [Nitrospiraceae bacterium]